MSGKDDEPITAWITKYALSSGIERVQGAVCADIDSNMLEVRRRGLTEYFHGDDWHRSSVSAVARANVMRAKKIASLKKSIQSLEELHIHVPKEPEVMP